MIRASAPAKVILFGEHAVVYDKLGIAAAVGIRSFVKIRESKDKFITVIDNRLHLTQTWTEAEVLKLKYFVDESRKKEDYESLRQLSKESVFSPIKYIISLFIDEHGFVPFELSLDSKIPMTSGMGSGSSLFASIAAAVAGFYRLNIQKKEISDITYQGDIIAHGGTPSGIDNNTVVYGGYIAFRKSEKVKVLDIEQKIPIVIGSTGIKGNTAELVAGVRSLIKEKPEKKKILDEIGDISQRSIDFIKNGNLEELGVLMNKNHTLLRELGVSHPLVEGLCEAACNAGALGAKLSGAGGGGIMIALADSKESQEKIAEAIKKSGGDAIITDIGVEGVRLAE